MHLECTKPASYPTTVHLEKISFVIYTDKSLHECLYYGDRELDEEKLACL